MSRFSDFDEFLNNSEEFNKKTGAEKLEKIKNARLAQSDLVSDIFSIFNDYYTTIIAKRRLFHMIFKKQEVFHKSLPKDTPQFLYRINLVPVEILPLAFDPSSHRGEDHLAFTKITKHDWHFDVSMQVNLMLSTTDDKNNTLSPAISVLTWGSLETAKRSLLPVGITISEDVAWHLTYTKTLITTQEDKFQKLFEDTLIQLTPSVFDHLEKVWKIKK